MFEKQLLYHSKEGPRIIIIGAGIAGLAAATRLLRNGYNNIQIIEAEDRIGGRVHTVPLKEYMIDLGAHWVHGEVGNSVYDLAQPYNLVSHSGDFAKLEFILSNQKEVDPEVGMTLYRETGDLVQDCDALKKCHGSLYDYFIDRVQKQCTGRLSGNVLKAYMDWLIKFECSIEGCDSLTDQSARGAAHYKQCDGDLVMNWKGNGYKTVIDLLLGTHKSSTERPIDLKDKLILNTEVNQIDYSGIGVIVKCKGGGVYTGDFAILTVSLGVLKDRYKTLFHPPLPQEKRKAIVGLGIGTVNKVYLKFPYAWWPEDCSGFSLLWLDGDKKTNKDHTSWEQEIVGFYRENDSPNILCAWLVGEAARDMESFSPDQVMNGCYRTLRKFLGHKYDIPEPEDILRSSWYSNPHFRGSYSFRSLKSDALNVSAANLAKPLTNMFGRDVLLFAGEATHDCFFSTVHGALETGWREADRIILKAKDIAKSVSWREILSVFCKSMPAQDMLRGKEVTIPMPWGNIAGKAWGLSGGMPVLCLHGFNDNAATYDRLLSLLLTPDHFYLAIDLPGHGKSDHYSSSSQLSAIEYLTDIRRICLHYGWESVTIIAHSLSSRFALYFAAIFPDQVKMLIMLDMSPAGILYEPQHICDIVHHEVEALIRNEKAELKHSKDHSEVEAFQRFKESRTALLKDEYILPIFLRSIKKVDNKVYFSKDKRNVSMLLPLITSQFNSALLSKVCSPTLIILSAEGLEPFEGMKAFVDSMETIKKSLKHKLTLIVTNSSHDMHIEDPGNIAPLILGYMVLKSKL